MMNFNRHILTAMIRSMFAAVLLCSVLSSCDKAIFDDEGDCTVTYRLKFRYDRNMKWADAFAHEVGSVHLFAFDDEGVLVWQNAEHGEALATEDYTMTLDLPAGDYHLLAWCGLENEDSESFSVPTAIVGQTSMKDLRCTMARRHELGGAAYSDKKLHPLFHGMLDVSLPENNTGGDYLYTMYLTKDTNHVRVILQHLSGETIDADDFKFRIDEENGLMNYNNSLMSDENINYREWSKRTGTAGLGLGDYPTMGGTPQAPSDGNTITSVSVAIADLTVARLMSGRHTFLTITAKDGHTVARIPLVDYALLLKDGYDTPMTDQEYLDREDEYALTFFLDERDVWIATSIIINSWRIVLNNVSVE